MFRKYWRVLTGPDPAESSRYRAAFATIQRASVGGLPRQAQRDALILDLTTYCLTRFPPPDDD